jgi:hypothetical protein
MVVPLRIEAEDDRAVQRVELHRIVNRGPDTAQTVPVSHPVPQVTQTARIDLPALHARPGDVIEYYATAYDNASQGIHSAHSERYWVWVLSDTDYAKMLARQRGTRGMLTQNRAQMNALRKLAQAQAQVAQQMRANAAQARAHASDPRVQAQTKALRQRQRALQKQARALAQRMSSHGTGQGDSPGGGQGMASGYSAPRPGSRPGGPGNGGPNGEPQQATALGLITQASAMQARRDKNGGPHGDRLNALSAENTERPAPEAARTPPKAADRDASRYPAEYRRLVRDYFKAVAEGK